MSVEEFSKVSAAWQNLEATNRMLAEFKSQGLLTFEEFRFTRETLEWTLIFPTEEAYGICTRLLETTFDDEARQRHGFHAHLKVVQDDRVIMEKRDFV